jgi:hypothetical protein
MSRSRNTFLAVLTLLGGCTFNVASFSRDVESHTDTATPTLHADFAHLAHLSGFGARIEGSPTATRHGAVVTVAGLLGSGATPEAIVDGVHIGWPVTGDTTTLTVSYDGPSLETVWTEGVVVTTPSATVLDVTAGSTSVDISGVTSPMHVVADSGSIDVRGAGDFVLEATSGSIDVQGRGGTATCDSGSIALEATAAVIAHAESGSIAGSFGGGGEMRCDSGSIDVRLVGALDRDLTLSADSGSIHLHVPPGTSMRVATHTGSGSSHVHVGGVDSGDDFTGTIGSGGFLVTATTSSGSIEIDEE